MIYKMRWGERSGSEVECFTPDRGAAYSSFTGVTALCHFARRVSCKVNEARGLHVHFAGDPNYSWFHEHSKNRTDYLYLHFIINI